MRRNYIILSIIFFVIGCFAAYFLDNYFFNKQEGCNCNIEEQTKYQAAYQAGWTAAEKRLQDLGVLSAFSNNSPVKSVQGSVISVKDKMLNFKIIPISPLDDPILDNRGVILDSNTKIFKILKKSNEQYSKEVANFQKELIGKKDISEAEYVNMEPSQTTKVDATVSDLNVGTNILVTSSQDIRGAKQFAATEIVIQY
jgi:hypothetical protein